MSSKQGFSAPGRAHIIIKGSVQGVGFRYFIQRHAHALELFGWAKNMPDGKVEAVFEGDESRIQLMLDKCIAGPPASSVAHADIEWLEHKAEFSSFQIVS